MKSPSPLPMIVVAALFLATRAGANPSCESLTAVKVAGATITTAVIVAKGDMPINIGGAGGVPAYSVALPEFCRVAGSIKPGADSDIRFEVWLPTKDWNQRIQQVGNGGLAGAIPNWALADALRSHWAAVGTDDGHESQNLFSADWVVGHPEKLIDYGYRAVHLTALASQGIVRAYYGTPPQHRYFTGCSDGGRESLMEAQRYPEDFDGYLAGAPGINIPGIGVAYADIARAMQALGEDQITQVQLAAIAERALEQCDAADGVKDGTIDNPARCHFNIKQMICPAERNATCLSAAQAAAMQRLYDGPKDQSGKSLQPGFAGILGTERNLDRFPIKLAPFVAREFISTLLYEKAGPDLNSLDLAQVTRDADKKLAPVMNPTADLRAAHDSGRKILMYNSWSDPNIQVGYTMNYLSEVKGGANGSQKDFLRLFMVPGWDHCQGSLEFGQGGFSSGGRLPADPAHDALSALQEWVEHGVAPEKLIATQFESSSTAARQSAAPSPIVRTRLLCSYPQTARYTGKGDTNDANNFVCRSP